MSNNFPCANPSICGVQSHRDPSNCRASKSSSAVSAKSTSSSLLNVPSAAKNPEPRTDFFHNSYEARDSQNRLIKFPSTDRPDGVHSFARVNLEQGKFGTTKQLMSEAIGNYIDLVDSGYDDTEKLYDMKDRDYTETSLRALSGRDDSSYGDVREAYNSAYNDAVEIAIENYESRVNDPNDHLVEARRKFRAEMEELQSNPKLDSISKKYQALDLENDWAMNRENYGAYRR